MVSWSLSSSITSRPLTIAPTGLIRSWQTREHSRAARSRRRRERRGGHDISAPVERRRNANHAIRGAGVIHRVRGRAKAAPGGDAAPEHCGHDADFTDRALLDELTASCRRRAGDHAVRGAGARGPHQGRPQPGDRSRRGRRGDHPARTRTLLPGIAGGVGGSCLAECRRRNRRTFILVDPLDGTREFIDGRDEFTVNIAIVVTGVRSTGIAAHRRSILSGAARTAQAATAASAARRRRKRARAGRSCERTRIAAGGLARDRSAARISIPRPSTADAVRPASTAWIAARR